jgi:hypothetical protein
MKINEDKTEDKYYRETDESGTIRYYHSRGHAKDLHRTDGPAVEYRDGVGLWFIEGEYQDYDDIKTWPLPLYLSYIKHKKEELNAT